MLVFHRDIISQLETVAAGAEEFTKENLEHRVPVASPNEMGKVGAALNVMAERLGKVIGELNQSRRFLEERVKEQTNDIRQANEALQQEIETCKRIHLELADQKKLVADVLNSMDDSIAVFDKEMRITAFNPAYQRRFLSGTPLIGKTCREVCAEFPRRCEQCPAETTLVEKRPVHSLESLVREDDPGKKVEWFDVKTSLLTDESRREVRGVIESRREVTDHISLETQLRHAQKMEAVGTLAGGIAHDFNNLLQIVLGYTDLLLSDKKPTDREYQGLHTIRKAVMMGSELVRSILAFSRKIEPSACVLNLNNEIQRVRKMLRRVVSKAIRIEMRLADDLMNVNADPGHLEQVLINLAVNAQHAMPDGGRLTIETANTTVDEECYRANPDVPPGRYVVLTVSDTGSGMEQQVLERIFEPFYTTKTPGEGTGLGLAMVHGMVKIHEGHITCHSEVGIGTAFKIYLPAVEQEIEQDVSGTREMPAFGTETLLVVDDEESIRDMSVEILTMVGYTALKAANGKEAVEVYRSMKDRISLVLLDLVMPEMGGRECLEELLKINPKVKVIISSGYGFDASKSATLQAGAGGFLKKPYDAKDMLKIVRRTLDA